MDKARRLPFSERINRSEKNMKRKPSYLLTHSDYPLYSFLLIHILIIGITMPFYFLTYGSNTELLKEYVNYICLPTFEFEKFMSHNLILIGYTIGCLLSTLNIMRFVITFYHWVKITKFIIR